MNIKNDNETYTEEKRIHNMPTIEKVNYEMISYLNDLRTYLDDFLRLPKDEARIQAQKNLKETGIIDDDGRLTGFYKE